MDPIRQGYWDRNEQDKAIAARIRLFVFILIVVFGVAVLGYGIYEKVPFWGNLFSFVFVIITVFACDSYFRRILSRYHSIAVMIELPPNQLTFRELAKYITDQYEKMTKDSREVFFGWITFVARVFKNGKKGLGLLEVY
jgi:hypothetical protein